MQVIWSENVLTIYVSVRIWNGLYVTDSTILTISQLITSTHWASYFTVHVYGVLHFYDSVWHVLVE